MQGASPTSPVTGELSNHKVAAVFASPHVAQQAADAVFSELSLGAAQVQLIRPDEPEARSSRKLEPESHGIWRTIVVAHIRLGIAGAVLGALAFAVLYAMGLPFVVNSAVAALLVLVFFGAVGGLMLGGLVALRPDHDRYVEAAHEAMATGRTTVVVHALNAEQRSRAADFLRSRGGDVTSTL
ncbi:hypothetical protein QLQ15_13560 [Lysobacter sp. LF1]|uniref:Riboflavin biosynthesis protein RibA n=1 Tax=Lysobacter stagni TaxID=3045172 RepID=A0ABT6XIF6_9GAMM|nr:hypothetical protein [Lysobacter sp. LF1]MDI9239934.1 hypothetical protein [Lysobacter sp. LF1]